ncbi:MAG: hypothetical protein R3C28_27360 [Pirellulaceae bacterium]
MRNESEWKQELQQADSQFQLSPFDANKLSQAVVQRRRTRRQRKKFVQTSFATAIVLTLAITAWNLRSPSTNRFATQSPPAAIHAPPSSHARAATEQQELQQQMERLQDRVAVLESLVADYEQLTRAQLEWQQEQFESAVSEQAMQRKLEKSKDLAITIPIDFGY